MLTWCAWEEHQRQPKQDTLLSDRPPTLLTLITTPVTEFCVSLDTTMVSTPKGSLGKASRYFEYFSESIASRNSDHMEDPPVSGDYIFMALPYCIHEVKSPENIKQ